MSGRDATVFGQLLTALFLIIGFGISHDDTHDKPTTPSPSKHAPQEKLELPINEPPATPEQSQRLRVTRIIDGDTFVVEGNITVRMIGIDTPELRPKNADTSECFSIEATDRTRGLLENTVVTLKRDVSNTDKYGRILRYVFIDDIFINALLVEEGYALARAYRPDTSRQKVLADAQRRAQQNMRGLWLECTHD